MTTKNTAAAIAEIAKRLRKQAGLFATPTGEVANGRSRAAKRPAKKSGSSRKRATAKSRR